MDYFGSGFKIKVSTDQLLRAANTLEGLVSDMRACQEELDSIVSGTEAYWEGQAGEENRKKYREKNEIAQDMLAFLSSYRRNLLKMAGIYDESEASNVEASMSLSSELIY